jgi:predicted enzyme related to lactoylglutathione lyase
MQFRFSRCICLQVEDVEQAKDFYKNVIGLEENGESEATEFIAGVNRIFLDQGNTAMGPILEFVVSDIEAAKEKLLQAGCQVVRWEGKGNCCYMRDPFGFVFNLWQEE